MTSYGNSNTPTATRTYNAYVALANLFLQFLVTFVTSNISSIAYVLPHSLKLLKLVFSERDAFSYYTLHRVVKINASGHKCSEACCGFGETPAAKMQVVVSILDKNVCSYRRSSVKNTFPYNHKHFVSFAAFVKDCASISVGYMSHSPSSLFMLVLPSLYFFFLSFSLLPIFFGRFSLLPKPFLSPHFTFSCNEMRPL